MTNGLSVNKESSGPQAKWLNRFSLKMRLVASRRCPLCGRQRCANISKGELAEGDKVCPNASIAGVKEKQNATDLNN